MKKQKRNYRDLWIDYQNDILHYTIIVVSCVVMIIALNSF